MPPTRSSDAKDRERLKHVFVDFLEEDPHSWDNGGDPQRALANAGVTRFNKDFIGLSMHDIEAPVVPPSNGETECRELPSTCHRRMIVAQAFFHFACRRMSKEIEITSCGSVQFNAHRTSMCNPGKPIVPWNAPGVNGNAWRKNTRPSKSDCKAFRDPVMWCNARDRFVTTLKAQGLSHLMNKSHFPNDLALDKVQQAWPHKVMQDVFEEPIDESIIKNHLENKETHVIWKEIVAHHGSSMTATLNSQKHSSHITSIRLHDGRWRGSQMNFLRHMKEQFRVCNNVSVGQGFLTSYYCCPMPHNHMLVDGLVSLKRVRMVAGNTDTLLGVAPVIAHALEL